MREEQSAPLANLSAVNYGNLPSCLSAFAAGLPFVSKSKAGICNIGTLPFLQGHVLHKRLMMGDIYSTPGLRVIGCGGGERSQRPLQQHAKPTIAPLLPPRQSSDMQARLYLLRFHYPSCLFQHSNVSVAY
ncbi:unnamed protein product [Pleuronectes platessa]|uniref:Uncharacterized protein n=1 Tax=Pleuronectes platessa TaxID=8262 RepID=A0A9N7UAL1_PLEPL|nr:unnamed protein product [Pleuronectes platessa]